MTIFLETNRLLISQLKLSDIKKWYELHQDPEVTKYLGGPASYETMKKRLEHDIEHYKKYGFSMCSVFEKMDDNLIQNEKIFIGRAGLVHLYDDDTQPDIEIGYVLHKEYWNKGYGQELVRALINWGFSNLKITKLIAATHSDNARSMHLLQKVGMQLVKCAVYPGTAYRSNFYEIYT